MTVGAAIDPGPKRSAVVVFSIPEPPLPLEPPFGMEVLDGQELTARGAAFRLIKHEVEVLAVETLAGVYGGSTGADQIAGDRAGALIAGMWVGAPIMPGGRLDSYFQVPSATWRACVTGSARAKDPEVRLALIDMFGGREAVKGKKCPTCKGRGLVRKKPCPAACCAGWTTTPSVMSSWTGYHLWDALGVAVASLAPSPHEGQPLGCVRRWLEREEALERRIQGLARLFPLLPASKHP